MKNICKSMPYLIVLFSILCAPLARAMENPADDLSEMNTGICQALEDILTRTPELSREQKEQLEQLIAAAGYSNIPMMSEEDFARFRENYGSIMRSSSADRVWYLEHLKPYLDESDDLLIEVKKTRFEKFLLFASYTQYFYTIIYPIIGVSFTEYCYAISIKSAWNRGENGSKEIAQWIQLHTLAYMAIFPRDRIDRLVGKFGIMSIPLRQLSYEQWQTMGQLYKQALGDMIGWFYK